MVGIKDNQVQFPNQVEHLNLLKNLLKIKITGSHPRPVNKNLWVWTLELRFLISSLGDSEAPSQPESSLSHSPGSLFHP